MEMDNSVVECIPDSSMIDNIIGDGSLILSVKKNDIEERCMETARTWKSIVTCIFGTDKGLSQKEPHCFYNRMMKHCREKMKANLEPYSMIMKFFKKKWKKLLMEVM
jgi:hypothetical protein